MVRADDDGRSSQEAGMNSGRSAQRAVLALWGLMVLGCATTVPGRPEHPPNPPGCESVVRQHLDNPEMAVDVIPRPRLLQIPPAKRREPNVIMVRLVVDESGAPIPGTIELEGAEGPVPVKEIKDAVAQWQFHPARHGVCRVPASYWYQIVSPPGSLP